MDIGAIKCLNLDGMKRAGLYSRFRALYVVAPGCSKYIRLPIKSGSCTKKTKHGAPGSLLEVFSLDHYRITSPANETIRENLMYNTNSYRNITTNLRSTIFMFSLSYHLLENMIRCDG